MTDYLQAGTDKAIADALTPQAVRAMGFDQVHSLCGKDAAAVGDVFVWEAVRDQIADRLERRIVLECEDGTLVTQN